MAALIFITLIVASIIAYQKWSNDKRRSKDNAPTIEDWYGGN